MSRSLLRSFLLAKAGLASALLASCGEGERSAPPVPVPSLSTSTADVARRSSVIPPSFRGEWNLRLEDCGGQTSDGRLVIAARALEFYESGENVIFATSEGDALTVSAEMIGEGETWDETYRFRLSPDGQALLQPVSQDDEGVRRLRCPPGIPR